MTDVLTLPPAPTMDDPPKGDGPAIHARYNEIRTVRNTLDNYLRFLHDRLRRECMEVGTPHHCLRCGYDWNSRISNPRPPRACPRCHSVNWDLEPRLTTARRPGDPPNPNWVKRVRKPRAPKPPAPPPVAPAPPNDGISPPPVYVPPVSVRFGEEVASGERQEILDNSSGDAGKTK